MAGPLTAAQFIRANADCPATTRPENGAAVWLEHYYLPHSSGLARLAVFRPAGSFQGARCAVFVHGGNLGSLTGWGAMTSALFTGKLGALAESLSAAGWAIVTIDYPMCSVNRHQRLPGGNPGNTKILGSWEEVFPLAMWPEQPAYVASAVQYLASNYTAAAGPDTTIFGAKLWGAGNSINPGKILLVGSEWGAQMALYASLQPTGYYPHERALAHDTMDTYVPRAGHRAPAVVALNPGPIDFTQFYVGRDSFDPNYYYIDTATPGVGNRWSLPPGTPFYLKSDRFHPFMRAESFRRWSTTAQAWKRQSPWFVLKEGHVENVGMSMFCEFEGAGYDTGGGGWDALLSASDWSPGTVRDNSAGGKAWIHPQDGRFQGEPWRVALQGYGLDVAAPIRKSVVNYTGSTAFPLTTSGTFAPAVTAWLASIGF